MTRKIILFLTLTLPFLTSIAGTLDDESEYVKMMSVADSAIARGDWQLAENSLRKAIKSDPANPANLLMLSNIGMLQFYQGRDSLALETLNDACNIAPRAIPVLANRATVLEANGRTEEALCDCNTILAIDSTNVKARTMRLTANLRKNAWQKAEADLDTLARYAPDDILTNIAAGSLYTATGRYAEAISPLTKVIEANPQAEYYAARAFCRIMTENLNDASQDIAEGLRINPLEGELYLYRAMLNKKRFRAEEAKSDAERAMQLGIARERALPFTK
ncbi:MAG: tetratricopeptide repeat protein [Muribaculaceae bacterium]|nr:tetratricopeptide repeat protein [Muribaculaceae bacterium]